MRKVLAGYGRRGAAVAAAVLALTGPGTAGAATGASGPAAPQTRWSKPTRIGGDQSVPLTAKSTVVAPDGTAVGLLAGNDTLYWVTRSPKSSTWSEPARLPARGWGELFVTGGKVVAVWARPGGGSGLASAELTASGRWSTPVPLPRARGEATHGDLDFTTGPRGTLTTVWEAHSGAPGHRFLGTYVMTRASDGTWSAPQRISARYSYPDVAVDAKGNTVVAFADLSSGVHTISRAAGARKWGAPVAVPGAREGRDPRVGAGPAGSAVVTWTTTKWSGETPFTTIHAMTRRTFGARWSGHGSWIPRGYNYQARDPLITSTGDVVVLWNGDGVKSVVQDGSSHKWSPVHHLTRTWVPNALTVATGRDGTVRVLWTKDLSPDGRSGGPYQLVQAARGAGGWSAPKALPGTSCSNVGGVIGAGAGGEATVLFGCRGPFGRDRGLWGTHTTGR